MEQYSVQPFPPRATRRWPRYQIDLPVRIIAMNGVLTTPVMGRGSDISRAGMALHANVPLEPGDLMQLQFPTAEPSRVNAIVRHRNGDLLGLEFLSQLPPDDETKRQMKSMPRLVPNPRTPPRKAMSISLTPSSLLEGLRRKQEEFRQLQKEIEVLSVAVLLLAEDDSEIGKLPAPRRLESDNRPWPLPS